MGAVSRTSLAMAAATLALASSAFAQIVVLQARGPSAGAYPQGSVLAPNRVISLRAGDRLEVLDAAGSHVLTGPVTMPARQVDTGSKVALQDIFKRANASHSGIAAVRGFSLDEGKAAPAPEATPLWRADVESWQQGEPADPHNFCVAHGQAPVLARETATSEGSLTIYSDATKATRAIVWPAGVTELAWPADIPHADGQLYALNLNGAGATQVRWREIPGQASSLTDMARAMLDAGCYDQLDTLQSQVGMK